MTARRSSSAPEVNQARRIVPAALSPEEFRSLGHSLVDALAEQLAAVPSKPVAPDTTPAKLRALLPAGSLPKKGGDSVQLLKSATHLLFEHSTFNGHPQFYGYITAGPAPLGILGDLLAAAVNQNCGAWALSPLATEIERQAVQWTAELIGYRPTCGGLFVSGGNMANMVCFLAARASRAKWDARAGGLAAPDARMLTVYATHETHTWLQKAVDLFGIGTNAIRWVDCDEQRRMRPDHLRELIATDVEADHTPFIVVGTAGTVSTGSIDPLREISSVCREYDAWFHVDGAYGAPAACLPAAPGDLKALKLGDSVAVDPHKWLYAPLEAGCALVRDAERLHSAFRWRPPYYRFDGAANDPPTNFFEWGPQNSRGFRALKVWLLLQQMGRDGYARAIGDDCRLARVMFDVAAAHPELEAVTHALSITTFRYVPPDLIGKTLEPKVAAYLDTLNEAVLARTQREGQCYLSNAIVNGCFLLRACIVNFRTEEEHVRAVPEIVVNAGRAVHAEMRPRS